MNDAVAAVEPGEHRTIAVRKSLLEKNAVVAERNRREFHDRRLLVLNLISGPGAGKTALLEKLLDQVAGRWRTGVIVGDLATDNDATRLSGRGAPVVQITTGTLCHLEASMVRRALDALPLDGLDLVAIENVGNLVCPAGFDLGESVRVVIAATTEGEDKPLKYPTAYHSADVVLVNKIDMASAVGFDIERSLAWIRRAAPKAAVFTVSARTGEGLAQWHDYIDSAIRRARHG